MFQKPYRDERNRVMFVGYGWLLLLVVPWWIGIYTIIGWIS